MPSLRRLLEGKIFREKLDRCFSYSQRRSNAVLRTKANSQANVDFGAVGTAYDYCLRLALMRTHNLGHGALELFPGFSHYSSKYKTDRRVSMKMEPHLRVLNDYLGYSLSDEDSLFKACLFLAKFDSEFRSGSPVLSFDVKPQDINELARIVANSNLGWIKEADVSLGPIFDRTGSKDAINADADLLIGNALIDVKTSSKLELKSDIRQLLGYYALNKLAEEPLVIDRLGVYYARFDFFMDISIKDLLSGSQEQALVVLFKEILGDNIECRAVRNLTQWVHNDVADAYVTFEDGNTLLHWMAIDGSISGASRLLKMGANINAKNTDGFTPLHLAIGMKSMRMAKYLMDAGADVDAVDNSKVTPLFMAVTLGQEKLAEILLNGGADVNCQEEDGWTSLHQAVLDGHKRLISLLIKHGAKADVLNKQGASAVSMASYQSDSHIYKLLRRTMVE